MTSTAIGASGLYRHRTGLLEEPALTGGLWAAGLAALPLLDLMTSGIDWRAAADGFEQLASLERVEVYQATGMTLAEFDISSQDAVALLRAHAVAHGLTASEVAYRVLDRRVLLVDGDLRPADGQAPDP